MKVSSKYLSLIFFFVCVAFATYAQSEDEPKTSAYIFSDFVEGTIKLESGATNTMKLNYNTFTQEMMYDESGQYAVLSNLNVDTIFINNRMFVPAEKGYYE